jgi:hypothetical protein
VNTNAVNFLCFVLGMTLNGDVLQFSFIACSLNDFEVIMKPTNLVEL